MNLPIDYKQATQQERRSAREQYVVIQGGKCHYCDQLLSGSPAKKVSEKPVRKSLFPPNFFKWPVHLHHCHKTNMTIGAVHAYCNAVLWQYHGE